MISRVAKVVVALSTIAIACVSARRESPRAVVAHREDSAASRALVPIDVRPKYASPYSSAIAVRVGFSFDRELHAQKNLDLELDTGSSGITVFASSLEGVPLERIGRPFAKTYGGGDVYEAQSAKAFVAIGAAVTPVPILISVVDRVRCAAERPECNASRGETYLTAQGFHGVLGVGLRAPVGQDAFSPISQMSGSVAAAYVVETRARALILGPSAEDLLGFERVSLNRAHDRPTLPNGAPAFDDRSLPVCITVSTSTIENNCAPTMVDSGSWSVVYAGLDLPTLLRAKDSLLEGTQVVATLPGAFTWQWNATAHEALVPKDGLLGGFDRILGMPFVREFDVLYDLQKGEIGFRRAVPPCDSCAAD